MRTLQEDILKNKIEYIDINSVAQTLSVSVATVRNWIKAKKIEPALTRSKSFMFDKKVVEEINKKILSGEFGRLQSRRNKKYQKGNFVPNNYVESAQYSSLATEICTITKEITSSNKIRLIVHELALILLQKRGYVVPPQELQESSSLTSLRINGYLNIGPYSSLLNELLPIDTMNIAQEDLHIISKLTELDIPFIEGQDFLGLVYLSLRNMSDRKISGSYYTPTAIVKGLVKETLKSSSPNPSLIDPCCGSGNFLIAAFLNLREEMLKLNSDTEGVESTILQKHLTGVDIDPVAVVLAKINLALHLSSVLKSAKDVKIYNDDTLKSFKEYEGRFDIVIGNPPWGFNFSQDDIEKFKKDYFLARYTVESYSLFIENAFRLLKHKGVISYVLPESILNVGAHATVRKLLLDNSCIKDLNLIGDKFSKVYAPAVTLITAKCTAIEEDNIDSIESIAVRENGEIFNSIDQKRFLINEQYIFNVRTSEQYEQVLRKIRNSPKVRFLKDNADFALGIVTGDNKQYISNQSPDNGEHIIKGSNVFKYNYYPGNSYVCFEPEKFQQVAPEKLYRKEQKLIYRFINSNLIFAYDNNKILTLNSANVLIPKIEGLDIKYVLAILNSRVAQFFHQLSFQTVKILRNHIESIPIPYCNQEKQREIIKMVEGIMEATDPAVREKLYNAIDDVIMELFQLSEEDKGIIHEKVDKVKYLARN